MNELIVFIVICVGVSFSFPPAGQAADSAEHILAATGVKGGLVVHLGCGDGKLTAAFRATESYVVHGLDADAANVADARQYVHKLGLYGPVSIEHWTRARLPYAGSLVNLVMAEDLGVVSMPEVMRVLAPGGVAYVKTGGRWTKTVNPRPDEIDEWTHFLHDASNNAVARDRRVGPPGRMQWNVGPLWSRSHEHVSSIAAMISGGGRLFYVVDEGLTSITHNTDQRIPERWMLVARDAFNGVLLWKRPLPQWRGDEWKGFSLRGRPASVPKRIVTDGQRLYATLSHRSGVSIFDPATGDTLSTIPGTEGAQELIQHGPTLIVYVDELEKRRGQPSGTIAAFDVDGNRPRWQAAVTRFRSASLAANGERVVCCDGDEMLCLSMADGSELWRASVSGSGGEKTIILHGEIVLEAGGPKIVARDAAIGRTLWTAPGGQGAMRPMDLFVAQGCAWHASADGITGYDLATGKAAKILDPSAVQTAGHHLRCYRAKATERFLITQFRGAEFVSLTDENHTNIDWVRGACSFGLVPANGLLYVPPNPCFCYPGAKLTGLLALAPAAKVENPEQATETTAQLERGPAYGEVGSRKSECGMEDAAPESALRTPAVPHSDFRIPHRPTFPSGGKFLCAARLLLRWSPAARSLLPRRMSTRSMFSAPPTAGDCGSSSLAGESIRPRRSTADWCCSVAPTGASIACGRRTESWSGVTGPRQTNAASWPSINWNPPGGYTAVYWSPAAWRIARPGDRLFSTAVSAWWGSIRPPAA
jgi:SAM-dependent methyltransferase